MALTRRRHVHRSPGAAQALEKSVLAECFFPDVTEWACDVNGTTSLVSTARAEALIGFETEHSMLAWLAEGESED